MESGSAKSRAAAEAVAKMEVQKRAADAERVEAERKGAVAEK
jgi:hypothetical protein